MKSITAAVVLSIAVTATPALARSVQCAPVTQAQAEGWFGTFNGAWASLDPVKVTALFGPNAALLPTLSNIPRTTPAAIQNYFETFLKSKPVGSIESSTWDFGCNWVSRVGVWNVRLTSPVNQRVATVRARYSFIYKFEGGKWAIDHLHSSQMPEPVATQ